MTTGQNDATPATNGQPPAVPPVKRRKPRKPKELSRQRPCNIVARVSEQELKDIEKSAKEVRLSVSAYIRHCVYLHQQARKMAKIS